MPLGAGSEVGRSCIKLEYKGKIVLLDCGVHPGIPGLEGLPFFDEIEMEKVRKIALGSVIPLAIASVDVPRFE